MLSNPFKIGVCFSLTFFNQYYNFNHHMSTGFQMIQDNHFDRFAYSTWLLNHK